MERPFLVGLNGKQIEAVNRLEADGTGGASLRGDLQGGRESARRQVGWV
ncbi:MAG: hypothetical protein OXG34_05830 [bacterium]|nr:hypothetical protein [bacterium]MCY3889071.1 hypothetical protein [bacterium]MCY3961169.1 hypothetical protein [bacterium]